MLTYLWDGGSEQKGESCTDIKVSVELHPLVSLRCVLKPCYVLGK